MTVGSGHSVDRPKHLVADSWRWLARMLTAVPESEGRDVRCPILGPLLAGQTCEYAARLLYRWCKPPTCGISAARPRAGDAIGRCCGESFASERWVRDGW